jgi:hypothetical protein
MPKQAPPDPELESEEDNEEEDEEEGDDEAEAKPAKGKDAKAEAKPAPKPVRPVVPQAPRRETGPATLGLTADPATPWTVKAGETTKLRFTVVNTGGPAKGLWVELGGQALTAKQVEGVKAFGADAKASNATFSPRAVLASSTLDAIEIRDSKEKLPPAPKPNTTIEVEIKGLAKGKQLLTVRVGSMTPKGPAATGSALCGRAIDVTD